MGKCVDSLWSIFFDERVLLPQLCAFVLLSIIMSLLVQGFWKGSVYFANSGKNSLDIFCHLEPHALFSRSNGFFVTLAAWRT